MHPRDFAQYHRDALEHDEARHNVLLWVLGGLVDGTMTDVRTWTLGSPGQCAVQTSPQRPIMLGELDERQCQALAEQTHDLDYAGVVGPDLKAKWFADRAAELGIASLEPVPQQIHSLTDTPRYPGAPGQARLIGADDASLFADWTDAFVREATPQ